MAHFASAWQIMTSSQEKDHEDSYFLLGNKSGVRYFGYPRKHDRQSTHHTQTMLDKDKICRKHYKRDQVTHLTVQ